MPSGFFKGLLFYYPGTKLIAFVSQHLIFSFSHCKNANTCWVLLLFYYLFELRSNYLLSIENEMDCKNPALPGGRITKYFAGSRIQNRIVQFWIKHIILYWHFLNERKALQKKTETTQKYSGCLLWYELSLRFFFQKNVKEKRIITLHFSDFK